MTAVSTAHRDECFGIKKDAGSVQIERKMYHFEKIFDSTEEHLQSMVKLSL